MKVAFSLIFLALLAACDERPSPATFTTAPSAPVFRLELRPITPLLPKRMTHIAVDPKGNVYWSQEADRADDTVFVIGEGDIPRPTQLSVANIVSELKATPASGNIQSLTAGPGSEIYFYFAGVKDKRTIAALGRFDPKASAIQILADTDSLMKSTGFGRSLSLARGTLIANGPIISLWLRHSDAWGIFRFDARKLGASGGVQLARMFDQVKVNGKPLELTREDQEISAGPGESLFVLDENAGQLLQIAADGTASVVQWLIGLPNALSTPVADRQGRLLLFAGASQQLIEAKSADQLDRRVEVAAAYPALLIFEKDLITPIIRDNIMAYAGFPVFGMRLRQLVPHAGGEGWISYDSGSGELLRLKIEEKPPL